MEGAAGSDAETVSDGTQSDENIGVVYGLLRRVVDVRRDEVRAMLTSFAFFFFLLSSYFVLRPIRDEVAAASGVTKLPWLFAGTLVVTAICNPLFSALVVRFPVRRVVPIAYQFFALSFVIFYSVLRFAGGEGSVTDVWTGRTLYVWITVFALFNTSIFWCLMADAFRSDQAKRLFGFIGVGGTIGSILGSGATAVLAKRIGTVNILLVSAALVEIAILLIVLVPLRTAENSKQSDTEVIGGSVWAGFTEIMKSPYLLGICVFMFFYVFGSTILYFAQSDLVGKMYATRDARTEVLAQLEFAAQFLTVLTQIFFTGRIIRWLGLAASLALLPAMSVVGFAALGTRAVFQTFAVFQVLRRATNFALMNPAMEVLFTVVKREDKYKAKNVIETFVYRGGDQLSGSGYAALTAIGMSLAGIAYLAVPLSGAWLLLGLWLGRRQAELATLDVNRKDPSFDPTTGRAVA